MIPVQHSCPSTFFKPVLCHPSAGQRPDPKRGAPLEIYEIELARPSLVDDRVDGTEDDHTEHDKEKDQGDQYLTGAA
jgi:hypothetical protein